MCYMVVSLYLSKCLPIFKTSDSLSIVVCPSECQLPSITCDPTMLVADLIQRRPDPDRSCPSLSFSLASNMS